MSGQEARAEVRCRNHADVAAAEPLVAPRRNQVVDPVADEPRHHDQSVRQRPRKAQAARDAEWGVRAEIHPAILDQRSEEHTSELQSRQYLVCRLLLEKKTKK